MAAWAVVGITALAMAMGATGGSGSEADAGSVSQVQGSLGETYAVTGQSSGQPVLLGLVVLVLTGLLVIGQGWARWALAVLGVVAVIMFALAGRWETLIAMAALVVGSLPLLSARANDYLAGHDRVNCWGSLNHLPAARWAWWARSSKAVW